MPRGSLRIYLGAAPGVGKTYAMLGEGLRRKQRGADVELLLDAGIDVISTLNIQHLESLNDVITEITGTVQRETVPDAVVRRADQLELVDMSPEALRRRMAHGNVYPAERVDAALSNYFRPGNLGALRELALLWVADRVEESLSTYLSAHGITETWETRERIVVGITGRTGGDTLIRRAARMAGRVGGDLVGVHISSDDGLTNDGGELLITQLRLVQQLGGRVHDVVASSPAEGLISFARAEKATQLVLGASRRGRWHELLHGSFAGRVKRAADHLDVHVIADHDDANRHSRTWPRRSGGIRRKRQIAWVLAIVGLPLLIAVTVPFRDSIALTTELLLYLAVVLVIAAIGGRMVAAAAAVLASLLVNWFFVVPQGRFDLDDTPGGGLTAIIALPIAVEGAP